MLATIYSRFSSAEQAKGSSIARQLAVCHGLAAQHGWTVTNEIREEGKSAFSGANRSEGGKLFEFERSVEAGAYAAGHVLIVEHLDRITRQGWEQVLPFLQKLTSNGVTVATADGNRIYNAGERVEMVPVIEAILKSELARNESENKSVRVRAAWQKKRDAANAGERRAITSSTPAWVEVDPQTREMKLIPERVEVLTRIGYGAQTLRDNGCAEFVHEADDARKLVTGLGTLSVDYGETTAILAVASKNTDDRVAALEAQVAMMADIIEQLYNKLESQGE